MVERDNVGGSVTVELKHGQSWFWGWRTFSRQKYADSRLLDGTKTLRPNQYTTISILMVFILRRRLKSAIQD